MLLRQCGCYLGEQSLVGVMVEEDDGDVVVALLGGDVQWRALVLGGGVRLRAVLQQQRHVVGVAQPR